MPPSSAAEGEGLLEEILIDLDRLSSEIRPSEEHRFPSTAGRLAEDEELLYNAGDGAGFESEQAKKGAVMPLNITPRHDQSELHSPLSQHTVKDATPRVSSENDGEGHPKLPVTPEKYAHVSERNSLQSHTAVNTPITGQSGSEFSSQATLGLEPQRTSLYSQASSVVPTSPPFSLDQLSTRFEVDLDPHRSSIYSQSSSVVPTTPLRSLDQLFARDEVDLEDPFVDADRWSLMAQASDTSASMPAPLEVSPVKRKPIPLDRRLMSPISPTTAMFGAVNGANHGEGPSNGQAESDYIHKEIDNYIADQNARTGIPSCVGPRSGHSCKSNSISVPKGNEIRPMHPLRKGYSVDNLRETSRNHTDRNESNIHPAMRASPYFEPASSVIVTDDDESEEYLPEPVHGRYHPGPFLKDRKEYQFNKEVADAIVHGNNTLPEPQSAEFFIQSEDSDGNVHLMQAPARPPHKSHHVTHSSSSYKPFRPSELPPTYEMDERLTTYESSPNYAAMATPQLTPLKPAASSPILGSFTTPFESENPIIAAENYQWARLERSASFESANEAAAEPRKGSFASVKRTLSRKLSVANVKEGFKKAFKKH